MPDALRFDGRVAVITGAGRGLGRAHALLLASRGANVIVNDVDDSTSGDAPHPAMLVVEEIRAAGGNAVACTESVSTPEGGAATVQMALDAFGRLDILVNNAGILLDAPFEDTTAEVLDPVLDVHLRGAFNVTRPAWKLMRQQSYGRIVSTTSSSGLFGMFHQTNYAAAKMGLVGLTRALAIEAADHNIKVNAVAPTGWTRMTDTRLPTSFAKKLRPELVSPVVAWLAHEDCQSNGEIFAAGGGSVARVVIGVAPGILSEELTVEMVRDNFDVVRDGRSLREPTTSSDEFFDLLERLELPNPFKT
jgi:NAD(P)-dependent dehydrogenase (short-subunit alcohol dehydrogenase family)